MRTLDSLSSHEFAALLLCSGHAKYATLCLNTPLSGQDFLNCSESDLEEIGITFRPHRLSILALVKKIQL